MADALLRAELVENIPELQDDEALLAECVSICKNHNKSGTELRYEWEARSFGSKLHSRDSQLRLFTMDDAKAMKADLVVKYQRHAASREQQLKSEAKRASFMSALTRRKEPAIVSSTKKIKPAAAIGDTGVSRVSFKRPSEDSRKRKYRYMYEKVSERSEILDERIDEFGELVRGYYNIDDLGDPSSTSEEDVVVVGRICCDVEASSSKLTEENIVIETSRMMGSGSRVPIRFSPDMKLRGMSQGMMSAGFFPGAIVALRGRNGGGNSFVVSEVLGLPRLPFSLDPGTRKSFTMAVACGPYTTDQNLDFHPFKTLLERLAQAKPAVILLLGPFVDANHPVVKACEIEEQPSKLFARQIGQPLMKFLVTSPETLILLSPSVRDFLSDHPVYPQPELESMFTDPRVKMIPNPSRFSINGVSFSCTSVDVLFHLRSKEYNHPGSEIEPIPSSSSGTDMFTNACRHILSQRSIYPIFPVPEELCSEVNLDVSHSEFLRIETGPEGYAPDVLILPSKFKQFTKTVDGTYAVNPSFLTKATYATISVPDASGDGPREAMACEIVRLQP